MKGKIGKALVGIILIAFGVLLALNALEVTNIDLFFRGWWTLFIIVPCFIELFTSRHKLGNLCGIAIGVLLLLASREVITYSVFGVLVFTMFIIMLGMKFIISSFKNKNAEKIKKEFKSKNINLEDSTAIFSGQDLDFSGKEFHGANLTAVFGGVKCDLTNAIFTGDVVIEATAIFGGIDILVPDNVSIEINATAILGGFENKKEKNSEPKNYTIYVNGAAIFGGVETK